MTAATVLVFRFNETIKIGLANKQFLPPTEYYSKPAEIPSLELNTREQVRKVFSSRNYLEKEWEESLKNGEFQEATADICFERFKIEVDDLNKVTSCIHFKTQSTKDVTFSEFDSQLITFDAANSVSYAFRIRKNHDRSFSENSSSDSRLAPSQPVIEAVPKAWLEPELVAQYLDGKPMMQRYRELGQMPTQCLNAVLAIEDPKFLEHSGVSVTGLARAVLANIGGGRFKQGGSTITQQMVKNYFLTSEKTLQRKLKEIVMSVLLETHASKDQILETYLNIIYLGQNGPFQVRGFAAASEYYFNRPLEELETADCALLAAVLNSPGLYDPFSKPENALKRRNRVLDKMKEHEFISEQEWKVAQSATLPKDKKILVSETAPYYLDAVNKEAQRLGIDLEGAAIFTGLSLTDQKAAQEAVQQGLLELETKFPKLAENKSKGQALEGTLISSDNKTGVITAIVGGRGYRLTQFNRAVDGHRQIGSIMKPIVFLTALLNSSEGSDSSMPQWNPLTILNDEKFTYKFDRQSWSPENYGKKYYGPVPMYFALKNSLNAATSALGISVGVPKVIETARLLGVKSKLDPVPSALLGAFELYPLEVAEVYTTLARMGSHLKLTAIRSIVDSKNEVLLKPVSEAEQVVDAHKVASLVSMMKQTVLSGTARSITASGFSVPAAGKTGTTSDNKDAWFAGFTKEKTTVAWVGFDNPVANGLTGASGAVPIWLNYMKKSTDPALGDFEWPEGIVPERKSGFDPEDPQREIELIF